MKIRSKLMLLLLLAALLPMLASSVLHRMLMHRLGSGLAAERRELLIADAKKLLQNLIDSYAHIMERDQVKLELMARIQALEAERRLAGPQAKGTKVYYSADYDQGVNVPADLTTIDKYFHVKDGKRVALPVSFAEQVAFVAADADKAAATKDAARLGTMPEVYRALYEISPDQMYWLYTSTETGLHTSWPGHGGYPDDYDPRKRRWYQLAKTSGNVQWDTMIEVSTRTASMAVVCPVRHADGSFAGVTAIDVPLADARPSLRLPLQWADHAETLLVEPEPAAQKLLILAQKSYGKRYADWRKSLAFEYLQSDDADKFARLTADVVAGRTGVRRMRYKGVDAFWAYGRGHALPLVIVPCDIIIADAVKAEQEVRMATARALELTGVLLLVVIVVTVYMAVSYARRMSRPVNQLAAQAEKLCAGDYSARVDIRTGDELQKLGETFNATAVGLREREKLKQSLALAMEIQQNLLPRQIPDIKGFDIAGKIVYCDETGGDYYDFIDLADLGPGRLGIAVGDVTGHGIAAALLMASARAALRSRAELHGTQLPRLFQALNRHIDQDTNDEWFMTLFYGLLNAEARTFQWASAGHDPVWLLRQATGKFEKMSSTGMPLGMFDQAEYEETSPLVLERGDIIVIGTDGIWEAANPAGEMFGTQQLREIIAALATRTAEEIRAAIAEAVSVFSGTQPQKDDITIVVVKAL